MFPRLLALGLFLAVSVRAADAPKRPNFLFIYTDDQRWDALSCVQKEQGNKGRFPWLQTPNMDRIAAEGVRFRNAFVTLSLCSPSRAAFLTGVYNHVNGMIGNHAPFSADHVTHATLLRQAGYVTGYIGKWHMGDQSGQRPGFDYSASYIGHGKYFDCPFEINGSPTPTTGWVDDVSTDYAIGFLEKNRDKPFDLVVGFKTPHGPWFPPERTKDAYKDVTFGAVPNLGIWPVYGHDFKTLMVGHSGSNKNDPGTAKKAGEGERLGPYPLETVRNYFRTIRAADDDVGRLLDALDRLGLTENTVVIYTTDNGFFLGEHNLGDKRAAYEESLRIPLLIRYPAMIKPGQVRDDTVLNIDLAPTLLDLAELPAPKEMQGRSWKPILQPDAPKWDRPFFYEYYHEPPFQTPTITAVRTNSAKLVKYPGHEEWTELFDLTTDPFETKNLAAAPSERFLLEKMEALHDREMKAVGYRMLKNPGRTTPEDPPPPSLKPAAKKST